MRIGSMINLADCVLILDGHRIPLSEPSVAPGGGAASPWVFGVSATDADYLASWVGHSGIVQTRHGVVLLRLKIAAVDRTLHLVHGEQQRR